MSFVLRFPDLIGLVGTDGSKLEGSRGDQPEVPCSQEQVLSQGEWKSGIPSHCLSTRSPLFDRRRRGLILKMDKF